MADDPRAIDVSVLADLVRLRRDEDLLAERLAKMESTREKVSAVVYRRVRGDYETRKAALEAQARAPRERAGREYAKLRVLLGDAERGLEEARLDDEELEFRHSLGEFTDDDFATRVAAARERLAGKQAELDSLARMKEDFRHAFGSEQELERAAGALAPESTRGARQAPPPPAPPPPAAAAPPPGARVVAGPSESTVAGDFAPPPPMASTRPPVYAPPPAPVAPPPPAPAPPPPPPVYVAPPPPPSPVVVAAPAPAPPAAPAAAEEESHGATMVMALPRIAIVYEDKPEEEFVLKREATHIGRLPRNTIQLPFPDVSREHATIVPEGARYKIVDRGSENGIYVNGDRVTEHLLSDGDIIQIGRRRLVFRV